MAKKTRTKKVIEKKPTRKKILPAKQRDYQVGDKKPPKEHQFQPGESGNPSGPPVSLPKIPFLLISNDLRTIASCREDMVDDTRVRAGRPI